MTKLEALAKNCIENHTHRLIDRPSKQDIYTREESIYISGYKECERQNKNKITELEQKLEQTEKDLTDYQFNYPKIKDLEKENAELKKVNTKILSQLNIAKDIINCLVHLGEFNENTDEEYLNYQVHDVLKQAENFLKE